MWNYSQSTGVLTRNGLLISKGYSGAGRGKNNPALEAVQGVGPCPRGKWLIGKAYNSARVGPVTLPLYAMDKVVDDKHDATGRSAFRIHGDSIKSAGNGSKGCIILPRLIREKIANSKDKYLTVTE